MHVDKKKKKLRMLGYVIWDGKRLQRWYVFDYPNELDK